MAQKFKVLRLSLQLLGSMQWVGFDSWPRKFHVPWAWPKKNLSKKRSGKPHEGEGE